MFRDKVLEIREKKYWIQYLPILFFIRVRIGFVEFVELSILTHRSVLYISDVSMPLKPSTLLVTYHLLVSYKCFAYKCHDLVQNRISWQFHPRIPKHFGQPSHDELYDVTKEIPAKQNVYIYYLSYIIVGLSRMTVRIV